MLSTFLEVKRLKFTVFAITQNSRNRKRIFLQIFVHKGSYDVIAEKNQYVFNLHFQGKAS